jgi:DNA polymerase I
VSDSEKIAPILRRLKEASRVVLDVETSGLDWKTNHIVGYSLAFGPGPADAYYLPVRHAAGGNLCGAAGPPGEGAWDGTPHPIETDLIAALNRSGLTIVGHNLHFDLRMMHRLGYAMDANYVCTQVNAALLDEYQGHYSLDHCTAVAKVEAKQKFRIIDHIRSKFPDAKPGKEMGSYWKLVGDDEVAVDYAKTDGIATWQLFDWQRPRITAEELDKVWGVECRLIPVLARMSLKGIKVDDDRFGRLCADVKRRINDLMAGFPAGFNLRSPINVRAWMEQHGHTDWPMTPPSLKFKEGQPSFAEAWLEQSDAGRKVVAVRKLITLRDSFLMPLQESHIQKGRVHTNFQQLKADDYGTITGRLSSYSPNLQQVSTHNEEIGRMHRSIFVPDDGLKWADVDWSQMEPRILAHYSQCQVLIEGYKANPPVDAHQAVAMAFTPGWDQLPPEQRKLRRELGKRCNQTILTGGGKGVLVKRYKMSEEDAARVFSDYFRTMPEIKNFQKRASTAMLQRNYVKTLLGRRCRLQDSGKAFVAVNRLLQGGNADAIKTKMVEIDDYLASEGRPLDMLLNCHDALSFQFPEEARPQLEECLRIMCAFGPDDAIPLTVPITVDAGEGTCWATAKFGEEKKT